MQQISQSLDVSLAPRSIDDFKVRFAADLPVWSTGNVDAWLRSWLLDLNRLGGQDRRGSVVFVIAHDDNGQLCTAHVSSALRALHHDVRRTVSIPLHEIDVE